MPPPSRRRLVLACALGLLAVLVDGGAGVPRLESAPRPGLGLGAGLVLASFVGLGTGPGVLSALVAAVPLLTSVSLLGPAALVLALLRVVEGWVTCLLYRRVGSLVLAAALYWLTAGLLIDLLVFGLALRVPADALLLWLVHQFVGGLVSGLLAEALLHVPLLERWLPARDDPRPLSLQQYIFGRVVFVASLPALALALLLADVAYDGALARSEKRATRSVQQAAAVLRHEMGARGAALQRLARQIEMDWNATNDRPGVLVALQAAPPGFEHVVLLAPGGRVLARSPGGAPGRATAPGSDLGSQPWFSVVRDRIGPAVSPLLRTGPDHLEGFLLVAEPLLHPDGRLRGALGASLESARLRIGLPEPASDSPVHLTLVDSGLRVVATRDPGLRPNEALRGAIAPADGEPSEAAIAFFWERGESGGLERALGLHRSHAAFARLEPWGLGVLARQPARETRREILPVAGRLMASFATMLLLLHLVVARFARRVSGPLLALDEASGDVAEGRVPEEQALVRLFSSPIAEIRSVARRFLAMRDALAYRDALTGLPNRALFLDRLAQSLAQARRDRQRLAVLRLGLDRFRLILDTLGHAAGDALLRTVAARLREPVREADTVARLAADEFVVLVRQVHEPGDAARVARKLLEAVRGPVTVGGREIVVTASLGLALFPGDAEDHEALLQNADAAMLRAKAAGGDTYRLYTPTMNDRALEQLSLESALRRAVAQNEFEVYYQPIVDLRTGTLAGMEALVRWHHPDRGLVGPAEFIGLAEMSGLIVPIGSFVLREATERAQAWRNLGLGPLRLEVNLSARQFQETDLLEVVAACLASSGLPAGALELEITESTAIHDLHGSCGTLDALRALGVRISLDDFGTGYSSLNYLKSLPVDTVKLDQSFVRHVASNRGDAAIATAILSLARSLDLAVIAEGVESRAQLDFLQGQGCLTMQGFFFSPPLPAADMEIRLRSGATFTPAMA